MRTSKHTGVHDSELQGSWHHSQLTIMEQIKDAVKVMATNQYHHYMAAMNPESTAARRAAMQLP